MKKLVSFSLILGVVLLVQSFTTTGPNPQLAVGDNMPMMAYKMKDISGSEFHLREMLKPNGLLVIFSCNTCPFVLAWEDRYNELAELCASKNVGMVLINSNEAKRNGDDSFEKMQQKAKAERYTMKYVVDKNHQLADAFGAKTTPHVYLFNNQAKLAYRGKIDDNRDKAQVSEHFLADAIKAMTAGKPINPDVTEARGCSIKRVN